ncbi:uncharacterized protein ColSpa_10513 [Colletotrichum spaethianum]|uniref:Uncharacterized protein n=1 Tax=Colletotrichum spaethianum TaxID=700344 RepID=A0AA37PDQ5_9PEZI|nr:uncharacterized protein ColSpa_10513 [Colletotrichum spaethianum]GKT50332.1 hypothetical protein ColSpa_10513 [Colletotrichum spaethianum]
MKTSAAVVLVASALASAQFMYNSTIGRYNCPRPNAAFCTSDSLRTDVIIRCDANGHGLAASCSNNLAGQFPPGVLQLARCWQSQSQSGDAACEKNCIVYAAQPFQLPSSVCTPYATASGTGAGPSTTNPIAPQPSTNNGTNTSSVLCAVAYGNRNRPLRWWTWPSAGGPSPSGNGTVPTESGGDSGSASGTRTPIPPSKSITGGITPVPTAGAVQNSAGYLALAGLVAAYFI